MHIAIDARIISSSTGRYVERLVYYLQEVDTVNTYTILVRLKDVSFFKPTAPNFTVKVADFADYSFAEQIGFKKFLDKLAPDLVHFCMPQQPILYKGKHVTTVHDLNLLKTYNSDKNWLIFHLKQLIGRYVFKKISKTSSHILVPSQFTKDEYIGFTGIPEDNVTLTYEAADISTISPQPYKQPFKDFIMYVGQQSDYKNIKRLGDAHQKLLVNHPNLGLILVGRKNTPALKNEKYFTKKGYKNILFTDFIEDPQRDWLFIKCKAYVFPSLMEGFGLPPLEAMGRGAPVISSSATCLPEINGNAARYFDPTNVDDIAKTIEEVIYNEDIRQDLIKKGFLQIKKYSWRKMARQTHKVYIDALKD
jgi:glycosyltransferase involved in cell wall biosynthesis